MSLLQNSNAISAGGYPINNSLRFQSASSQYLSRTPSVTGNQTKWTWSAWVKRGSLGSIQSVFGASSSSASQTASYLRFTGSDTLEFLYINNGSVVIQVATSQVFRDPSAWYHLVLIYDSTDATASNRVKIYVNGTQVTAFGTATYPSLNASTNINAVIAHTIGSIYAPSAFGQFFDGYQTEINFINDQALTPSSFGETNTLTGQWVAKKYTGTYGTNGFYLPFSNGTSTTTLGADSSGNGNNWTLTNFTRSAGVNDCWMYDVPSGNGGASGTQPSSNYAVMNSIGAVLPGGGTNMPNFAAANLTLNGGSAVWRDSGVSTINMKSGKWYVEVTINTLTGGIILGLIDAFNAATVRSYRSNGTKYINATNSAYGSSYGAGNVIGFAIDCDGGTLTCYVNNVSQGSLCADLVSAMPTNGWFFNPQIYSSSAVSVNFGQRSFAYTPPSGYKALCTANLPASTIVKGNQYMDATLYTGDGTSSKAITNTAGFSPDLVWVKNRSNLVSHVLVDAVRGASNNLASDLTAAENSGGNAPATYGTVSALNSNGFTVAAGTDPTYKGTNGSGQTYVAWQWDAGSSTVTNTNGTISSQVRANPTAGVSVVTLTTQASGVGTYGHGLGVAPKMIIHKFRSVVGDWSTYHESLGNTKYIFLNTTGVPVTNSIWWNNTSPNSSVVTLGSAFAGSSPIVAYCFAEVSGFSKISSYVGNASADGPFVYCGFRPKYVLIRNASIANSWPEFDTARNPYNLANSVLFANVADAETSAHATINIDFLSNGFKVRGTNDNVNGSGHTHIFMAFAENPFAQANAR